MFASELYAVALQNLEDGHEECTAVQGCDSFMFAYECVCVCEAENVAVCLLFKSCMARQCMAKCDA